MSLIGGELLLASMYATLGLVMLVECVGSDGRSTTAKRLGQGLTIRFVVLTALYLYTTFL